MDIESEGRNRVRAWKRGEKEEKMRKELEKRTRTKIMRSRAADGE